VEDDPIAGTASAATNDPDDPCPQPGPSVVNTGSGEKTFRYYGSVRRQTKPTAETGDGEDGLYGRREVREDEAARSLKARLTNPQ
jgi:hypothetical protein